MTATSPITTLAELARDRFTSSKQHDYDSRIEPRSMIADYTLNGRHPYGDEGNNSNGTSNNYASEGHYNREETQSQGQGDSYHPSSAPPTHYPHSGAYLPPPIQTLPFGGVHPHSFASPTSPSLSTTPISPVGHFQHPSSDHYEYDQSQGNYHAPSYHAYHASYPEHHHPL
ncbi:hypothetical protein BG003_007057 [Podila horticola]|nr:hypothetical protein BG003_007057 [Podila horticola]